MLCNGLIALKDSINIFFLVCMRYKYKLVFFAYVCGKLIVKKKYICNTYLSDGTVQCVDYAHAPGHLKVCLSVRISDTEPDGHTSILLPEWQFKFNN